MSVSLVALCLFLAVVCAVGFIVVVLHRWAASRAATTSGQPIRLRRVVRSKEATGPVSRFDGWFQRMVRDTGLAWHPTAAAMLLVLCGCIAAGSLFLWQEEPVPAVLGLLAGMAVPLAYLLHRRRKRIRQLPEQLPAALGMLARSVRAGQSLDQALQLVGTQSPQPLAADFNVCAKQLEMGMSMPAVMRLLVERVNLHDMRIFTTTLAVHRQTGGNIARVLERLAAVVRDRLSYRQQLRVATGAGKASAIMVAVIGPLIFLFFFFFRPDYINSRIETELGQTLLILAAFLEIVGLVWMARLLRPAY
jgi:tight adherence protein B